MKYITCIVLMVSFLSCKSLVPTENVAFLIDETPNDDPLAFMEHLVPSDQLIHKGSFNPDLDEYYYTISDDEYEQFDIYVIKKVNNKWSSPERAFFNSEFSDHGMCFSPDGNSIYFSSTRPTDKPGVSETWHIWKAELIKGKWSNPVYVDIPNLRNKLVSHPTITNSGKLYFHSSNLDYSDMDIYETNISNGEYENAIKTHIPTQNRSVQKCTPFVAADEEYLLFATIGEDLDIMIAYNDGEGNWINTRKLNEVINTDGQGNPFVTPDDRFLFYTTGKANGKAWKVNWVNIESELKRN